MKSRADAEILPILGKTIVFVRASNEEGEAGIRFHFSDRTQFGMVSMQDRDCIDRIKIESIDGNIQDLIGQPIILAEKLCCESLEPQVWIFFNVATAKGSVKICWSIPKDSLDEFEVG